MSEKIVLIVDIVILNRAFYGVPALTNSEGLHTNAVYGFFEYYVQDFRGRKTRVSDSGV